MKVFHFLNDGKLSKIIEFLSPRESKNLSQEPTQGLKRTIHRIVWSLMTMLSMNCKVGNPNKDECFESTTTRQLESDLVGLPTNAAWRTGDMIRHMLFVFFFWFY